MCVLPISMHKPARKMFLWWCLVASLASVQCLVATQVLAREFYVDVERGNDENDGRSPETAVYSLQRAMSLLQPGDDLLLMPGEYREFPDLNPRHFSTATRRNPINVKSQIRGKAIISVGDRIRLSDGLSGWRFSGLVFQNSRSIVLGERVRGTNRCRSSVKNVTFSENTFRHASEEAIIINCARHVQIRNNAFWNVRSRQRGLDTHAILSTASARSISITGNSFTDIGADGVQLQGEIVAVEISSNRFKVQRPYRYRGVNGAIPAADKQRYGNVGENAIDIKGGPGPVLIEGNTIQGFRPVLRGTQDASGAMGVGIVLHQMRKTVAVQRNHFVGNVIHLNLGESSENALVSHNVFDNVIEVDEAIYGKIRPKNILLKSPRGLRLYNNVFRNVVANEKLLMDIVGGRNISMVNNVFSNGSILVSDSIRIYAGHNAWSRISAGLDDALQGTGDIYTEQLDIDWSTWRPRSSSPLIDAGATVDVAGDYYNSSIIGGAPDIGVAEFNPAIAD